MTQSIPYRSMTFASGATLAGRIVITVTQRLENELYNKRVYL